MDNHKDKQEHSLVDDQTANKTRRQIIRGMAAAPVVLTLSNGHAQSVASNLRCITESATPGGIGTPDTNNRICLPDSPPVTDIGPPSRIGPTGNPVQDTGPTTAVRSVPGDVIGAEDYRAQSCVLYVDSNGNPVAPDPFDSTAGGIPTAASCYTSFTPT